MIEKKVFILILILLSSIGGCSSRKLEKKLHEEKPKIERIVIPSKVKSLKRQKRLINNVTVWHLIAPKNVEFILLHLDKTKEARLILDESLSKIELRPGSWQIVGVIIDGERYSFVNSSQRFIFKTLKSDASYVGSMIVQCPKVDESYIGSLKRMSFFNRYTFSTENKKCELIVGNLLNEINSEWKKTTLQPLKVGF